MLTQLAVPYADASASALSWWLGEAPAALDELELRSPEGVLVLRVLGASHQALARLGALEVPEVVACGEGRAALPASAVRELPGGTYRFRSTTSRYDERGLAGVATRLLRRWTDDDRAVVGVFPGSPHALTALAGRALPRGWSWRTWHVYPGTGEVVRTSSSLVVP